VFNKPLETAINEILFTIVSFTVISIKVESALSKTPSLQGHHLCARYGVDNETITG